MSGPYITKCDDGSTLIEWILPGARFYISIEPDPSESSWGYVDKDEGETGVLPSAFVRAVAPDLLTACKAAFELFQEQVEIVLGAGYTTSEHDHEVMAKLRATIAKVEGD